MSALLMEKMARIQSGFEKTSENSTKLIEQQMNPTSIPDFLNYLIVAIDSEREAIKEYDTIVKIPGFPSYLKEAIMEIRNDEKDHIVKLSRIVYSLLSMQFPKNTKDIKDLPEQILKIAKELEDYAVKIDNPGQPRKNYYILDRLGKRKDLSKKIDMKHK